LYYGFSEPGAPSSFSPKYGELIVGLTTLQRKKIAVKKPLRSLGPEKRITQMEKGSGRTMRLLRSPLGTP